MPSVVTFAQLPDEEPAFLAYLARPGDVWARAAIDDPTAPAWEPQRVKCIVLQNADGGHLGFMLCSPGLDQPAGDCVFVPVPGQAALFDTREVDRLFRRREAGESAWEVIGRQPLSVVVRTPGVPAGSFIELGGSGRGQWGVGSGPDRQIVGHALLPPS